MKKLNSIIISSLLLISATASSAPGYKMQPDPKQPSYSRDPSLDYLVKETRKTLGFTVDEATLKNSTKYSDIEGKLVFSNDGHKVGKVHELLFSRDGDVILIISSGGVLPVLDFGDTKRAIYAYNAYFSKGNRDLYLLMDKEQFVKEPTVKKEFFLESIAE